jgi:hypothetical protein
MSFLALVAAVAGLTATPPQFSADIDNAWFPLRPGTTYVYTGMKDGQPARDVFTVTRRVKTIAGAPCVEVHDRLYLRGRLHERTIDWYSQDSRGNVWYFGEETAELGKDGRVISTEGTWRAGRGGAQAGIFMFAHPRMGRSARQELYKGHAEDHFQVLRLHAHVKTPYVESSSALLTKEWTPLEPGVIDHKLYLRGIGTVLERSVKGARERLALVSLKRG